jgi:hypothetical protein
MIHVMGFLLYPAQDRADRANASLEDCGERLAEFTGAKAKSRAALRKRYAAFMVGGEA